MDNSNPQANTIRMVENSSPTKASINSQSHESYLPPIITISDELYTPITLSDDLFTPDITVSKEVYSPPNISVSREIYSSPISPSNECYAPRDIPPSNRAFNPPSPPRRFTIGPLKLDKADFPASSRPPPYRRASYAPTRSSAIIHRDSERPTSRYYASLRSSTIVTSTPNLPLPITESELELNHEPHSHRKSQQYEARPRPASRYSYYANNKSVPNLDRPTSMYTSHHSQPQSRSLSQSHRHSVADQHTHLRKSASISFGRLDAAVHSRQTKKLVKRNSQPVLFGMMDVSKESLRRSTYVEPTSKPRKKPCVTIWKAIGRIFRLKSSN
ncbi:hypothetical protein FQN57_007103 [Myotisia sp. PD_48]|nr:hypothetical protein FQN57_007103 [Myotisia sp. PD_48]